MRVALTAVAGLLLSELLIGAPAPIAAARQREFRTIYVTALDRDGRAVTDLQAADFAVKVGNKPLDDRSRRTGTDALADRRHRRRRGNRRFSAGPRQFHAEAARARGILADLRDRPARRGRRLRQRRGRAPRRPPPPRTPWTATRRAVDGSHPRSGAERSATTDGGRRSWCCGSAAKRTSPLSGDEVREQLRRSGALLHVVSTLGAQRRPRVERASGHLLRAGADGGQRHRHEHPEPRTGARRWGKRIGRPSRPGAVDTRSCRRSSASPTSCCTSTRSPACCRRARSRATSCRCRRHERA